MVDGEASEIRVAVSTLIFALQSPAHSSPGDHSSAKKLYIPLVRRIRAPHKNRWALPGGWVQPDEALNKAAARTLSETTRLEPSYLEQLYTFGRPNRSPGQRVISIVYSALVRDEEADQAGAAIDDENVGWFCIDDLPQLAFDHQEIVEYGLWRLRNKVEYAHVAVHFIGETFSLSQLREVYEAILQKRLDPANFRRKVEATGTIVPTSERLTGGRHRPPRLYRVADDHHQQAIGPVA